MRVSSSVTDLTGINGIKSKTVVIKYGGSAMVNEELKNSFAEDVAYLKKQGIRIVIVHGGGKEISELSERLNVPVEFKDGLRCTGANVLEIVQLVLAGKINKNIALLISKNGVEAAGICGTDAGLLRVKKYTPGGNDIGLVGTITSVNLPILKILLNNDIIPVVAPLGIDDAFITYNINADLAAEKIACALEAEMLLYISDVEGIFCGSKVIPELDKELARKLIKNKIVLNGMIPKINSAFNAMESGVKKIIFIDGRKKHCLRSALSGKRIIGTQLTASVIKTMHPISETH